MIRLLQQLGADHASDATGLWLHGGCRRARDQTCAGCHSIQNDLAGIGGRYGADALRTQILEPRGLRGASSLRIGQIRDARINAGRDRHRALLENYAAADVASLVAYLQSAR